VNRAAGDDALSDAAMTEGTATDGPWTRRDRDTLYRRPPARPAASDDTGSWFNPDMGAPGSPAAEPEWGTSTGEQRRLTTTGEQRRVTTTGEQRAIRTPIEPEYGPATPTGTGRTSFGFSAGPISPVRQSSAPPANTPEAAPVSPARHRPDAVSAPPVAPISPARHRPDAATPARRRPGSKAKAGTNAKAGSTPKAGSNSRPDPAAGAGPVSRRLSDADLAFQQPESPERLDRADLGRVPGDAPAGDRDDWATSTSERRREQAADSYQPRQSRVVTMGIVVLSVIVLLSGTIIGVVYFSGSEGKLDSVLQLGSSDSTPRTVTAPLDNRTSASFELLAATNRVKVSIGELGDDLYRISAPEDAGIEPSPLIRNDDVKLQVTRDGDGTGGELEVVLAAKVRWSLRFSGYAEQQIVDLTGGQVSGIEMVAGARRTELSLSQPSGTVPLKVNGAVEELLVKSPAANPVRVKVGGGADTVVAGSQTRRDVAAGSTFTPRNWATDNRYDLAAGARITSLTVESA
jgi:hypothetical protein